MMKNEFENLIHGSVTDEEYELIETVYMWHPAIRNTSGKEEVAELYKSFGIVIFYDMYASDDLPPNEEDTYVQSTYLGCVRRYTTERKRCGVTRM